MGGVGLRSVVASSGVAGLFVGYGSFLLCDLLFDVIEFVGYELLKKVWGEMKGEDGVIVVEVVVFGLIAGAFTGAVTTSFDVVKMCLMMSLDVYCGVL